MGSFLEQRLVSEPMATKNKHFHTFCKHFENFVLCLPENLFSLAFTDLKLISVDIFRSCSIKNQGLSRTKNQFQDFQGLEIRLQKFKGFQDLSRRVQTLCIVY